MSASFLFFIPQTLGRRYLQFLTRMDLVRVLDDVAICLVDGVPADAVFFADLREVVTRDNGVGVGTTAGRGTFGNVEHEIAGLIVRVDARVLVPQLLLGLGRRCAAV